MSNNLTRLVAFLQFLTDKTQAEIAQSINYTGPHFNVLLKKGYNEEIERILREKYQKEINEFFGQANNLLQEDSPTYEKEVKIVDAEQLLVHDSIIIKGMLRVMLKNQATVIAGLEKKTVASVLKRLTKAVRDETSEEFDEL